METNKDRDIEVDFRLPEMVIPVPEVDEAMRKRLAGSATALMAFCWGEKGQEVNADRPMYSSELDEESLRLQLKAFYDATVAREGEKELMRNYEEKKA